MQSLANSLATLPPEVRDDAQAVLASQADIRVRFQAIRDRQFRSLRIRCHGNYHLGQLLYTGKDFVVTDFEGDPEQSLSERRGKRSAMCDVAHMLRLLLTRPTRHCLPKPKSAARRPRGVGALVRFSLDWVSAHFLHGYLEGRPRLGLRARRHGRVAGAS